MNFSNKFYLCLWGLIFLALWAPRVVFGQPFANSSALDEPAMTGKFDKASSYFPNVFDGLGKLGMGDKLADLSEMVRFPWQNSRRSNISACPIVLSNGEILLVWGAPDSLAFARSSDGGETWQNRESIATSLGYTPNWLSGIYTTSSRAIIVWQNPQIQELMMSYSDDDATTWSQPVTITNSPKNEIRTSLCQTMDGTLWLFYVSEVAGNARDIFYRTSGDNGITWSNEETFLATAADEAYATVISANLTTLLAFYQDNSEGYFRIYQMSSTDNGMSWSLLGAISQVNQQVGRPQVLRGLDNTLWLIYLATLNSPVLGLEQNDIYYMTSGDNGSSWSPPERLTQYVRNDDGQNITMLNNNPFVAFISYRWANFNQQQIWYGMAGVSQDINPPPALFDHKSISLYHNSMVTVRATVDDESGIFGVRGSYSLNGGSAISFDMDEDGDHVWGAQIGPFQVGNNINFSYHITDTDIPANTLDQAIGSVGVPLAHTAGNMILSFQPNSHLADGLTGFVQESSAYWPATNGPDYLYDGGLWIGAQVSGEPRVMNCWFNDLDWRQTTGSIYSLEPGLADQVGTATYDDQLAQSAPIGLEVTQQSYQWSTTDPDHDDFIIIRYTIRNTGLNGDLTGVMVGMWTDPDLPLYNTAGATDDMGRYEADRKLAYVYDSQNNPGGYFGIKLLGGLQPQTVSIYPNGGFEDTRDDGVRYQAMNRGIQPDPLTVADYRILITTNAAYNLPAGQSQTVSFGIVMGNGVDELRANSDAMEVLFANSFGATLTAPYNLLAVDKLDGQVALFWEAGYEPVATLTGFNIYRTDLAVPIALVSPDQRQFVDTNVNNGQIYSYYITALYNIGESSPSDITTGYPMSLQNAPGNAVSYARPGGRSYGIAFDGSSVWMANFYNDQIVRFDPLSWQPQGNIPAPGGGGSYGLAWDGTSLWVANINNGMLYQIDLTGNILQIIDVPTGINPKSVTGVACENGHVWTMDRNNGVVYQFDGTSGMILQTFPFPPEFQGTVPRDLAYLPDRGTFIVGATYGSNHSRVYEFITTDFIFTGNAFDFDMEFDPSNNFFYSSLRGIAYNPLTGNYWLGDVLTDIIYEVLPFSGQINGLLVTNTNDAGFGSLRQAINNANSDGQPSTIEFSPALMGQTIYPQTQLPNLIEDGTSINGDINADGLPDIEINRGSPDIVNGIFIESANNTLRGLLINNFNGPGGPGYSGIRLTGSNAHHNTIVSCYIGTDITKSENRSNRSGILIRLGAHDNTIGGSAPGQGNVIYNNVYGVNIADNGSIGNTITRNSIAGNGIAGIILSSGGNNQIASPVITDFSGSALTGTAYPFSTVEVFADAFNQGDEYLGTTFSEMSGNFSFSGVFPENRIYNVTVTDPSGNTSAFSSFLRQKEINANHWRVQLLNNGTFAQDFLVGVGGNGAGGEYPKGLGTYIIYSGGHYLGTLKNGTPSVSHIEYTNSDYLPGRIINENPAPLDQLSPEYPLRSKNRVYVIDSTRSGSDWDNWPEEDGAPVDANGDPLLISPQDSWTVFNDMYVPVHSGGGEPVLGLEVQRSTYSYTLPGASDAFIVKWKIINKSTNNYPESYFGIWFDPDLVDYANDLMGTDTILNMAYFYNSNNNDVPRAFGACLLKGPIADGQVRELAATYGFGAGGDPVDDNQRYNILRGFDRWGNPKPFGSFDFTGDPLTNLGNLDWNPAEKRLIISSGPFTLYAGNIQEVVVACIGATGGDRLEALANLKETTRLVQEFYNRPTVSISMTKGVRNFKTPVRIEVNNPKSLLGGDFKILYDRNILTLAEADIKLTPLTSDFVRSVRVTQNQGIVSVALSRATPIASEQKGVLIKLPFRVNSTAPLGSTTQLIFSEANLSYQYSLPNLVNPIIVKGSLKVMDNPLFGDLNQNGSYDLPDAVLILKAIVEMFNDVDPYQELLADANRNNVLAINDAMVVLNQLVLTKTSADGKDSDIPADTTIDINLKISSIQGSPGETVIIPLQSDSLKLFGFDCALRYDARALKLKAVVPVSSSDLFINNVADQGQLHFALLNREGIGNENGVLINLEFEILSGGEHFLTIDKAQGIPSQQAIGGGEIPEDFALYQNYPNPFNPGTTIRYDLPQDSRVHLVIFNTLGQKIVTLVNEDQKAGKHQFDWYPQQLSSGIYIISINAGDFVEHRKAIFMK